MKAKIASVQQQFEADIAAADGPRAVEDIRIRYLGKKGLVTALFKQLGQVSAEERPQIGKQLNALRQSVEAGIKTRSGDPAVAVSADWIDLTLPGRRHPAGRRHPLTQIRDEVKGIFGRMGFRVAEGPEVEDDYLNFEALNIPKLHPARNMQDTLYISDDLVLRTHTSPVQIRTMKSEKPPIRIIAPGRVYRRDTPDASHSPFFHQVEGLCIDKNISLGDLKAVLLTFMQQLFGEDTRIRFRPSYFPFTEPSAEMDIWWATAKGGRWLELLGCGMVHPNVLRECDIDPEAYSGWAFGVGIDRLAMMKFGIDDIRLLFDNDLRFLRQF